MSVTRQQIIDEARTWLGVGYANQGRSRSIGIDCGGLMIVVGRALGLTELEHLGYSNSPDGETFEKLLLENCDEVVPFDDPKIADILTVNYGSGIQHSMFLTRLNPVTVIHAKRPLGVAQRQKGRGVVEHRLLPSMDDFRCWKRTFRLRGITD